jgi:hypothetical protein
MLPANQIRRAAALAFALGAIATPAASARLDPNDVSRTATTVRVVRPNPDEQPPPVTTNAGPRSEVVSGGGYDTVVSGGGYDTVVSGGGYDTAANQPTLVRVISPNHAFDWGDAGIGAAGAVALSLLALGVAFVVLPRRSRRSTRSGAMTN